MVKTGSIVIQSNRFISIFLEFDTAVVAAVLLMSVLSTVKHTNTVQILNGESIMRDRKNEKKELFTKFFMVVLESPLPPIHCLPSPHHLSFSLSKLPRPLRFHERVIILSHNEKSFGCEWSRGLEHHGCHKTPPKSEYHQVCQDTPSEVYSCKWQLVPKELKDSKTPMKLDLIAS